MIIRVPAAAAARPQYAADERRSRSPRITHAHAGHAGRGAGQDGAITVRLVAGEVRATPPRGRAAPKGRRCTSCASSQSARTAVTPSSLCRDGAGVSQLPIDDRLRAVARGQFSRLAQYEIEVENPLRPKEIQDRIRAGETADEIADAAGVPIERVRRFEGPVLAEREYRAQEAQRATVRSPGDSGPGPRLGDIVAERLSRAWRGPDDALWDSRKRADGNWQVQLDVHGRRQAAGGRVGLRSAAQAHRPDDDEAARLCLPEEDLPAIRFAGRRSATATVTPIASRLGGARGAGRCTRPSSGRPVTPASPAGPRRRPARPLPRMPRPRHPAGAACPPAVPARPGRPTASAAPSCEPAAPEPEPARPRAARPQGRRRPVPARVGAVLGRDHAGQLPPARLTDRAPPRRAPRGPLAVPP